MDQKTLPAKPSIRSAWERVLDFWFRPMDPLPLRVFEIMLCTSMAYYFSGHLKTPDFWLGERGYHVSARATSAHYITPPPLPPEAWLNGIIAAFYLICVLYILGIGRRLLAWVLFAVAVYIQAMDQPSSFTVNRMFIVSFFFLALQPKEFVIEGKRRVSGFIIRFFQATLLVQYSTAGICKMYSGDWLESASVVWTQSQGHYKTPLAAWAVNDMPMFMWWGLAASSLVFEFAAPLFFICKRSRMAAIVFGILFHLSIATLMKDLIFFSLQMITPYVFFLDPGLLRNGLARLRLCPPESVPDGQGGGPGPPSGG
jgi:hypothetical protein